MDVDTSSEPPETALPKAVRAPMVAVQVATMVRSTGVGRKWSLCVASLMGAAVEECASQMSRMAGRGRSDMMLLRLPG